MTCHPPPKPQPAIEPAAMPPASTKATSRSPLHFPLRTRHPNQKSTFSPNRANFITQVIRNKQHRARNRPNNRAKADPIQTRSRPNPGHNRAISPAHRNTTTHPCIKIIYKMRYLHFRNLARKLRFLVMSRSFTSRIAATTPVLGVVGIILVVVSGPV